MAALLSLGFTKADLYAIVVLAYLALIGGAVIYILKRRAPSIETLQDLASLFNTKGGIILCLLAMWAGTLGTVVCICMWAIIHGVDPQNGILILLMGVLTSGAWGNVNGALFKTMDGATEVKKNGNGNGGNGASPAAPATPPTPPTQEPHP